MIAEEITKALETMELSAKELADVLSRPVETIYQHLPALEASGHVSVWVRKKAGHRIALWQLER